MQNHLIITTIIAIINAIINVNDDVVKVFTMIFHSINRYFY